VPLFDFLISIFTKNQRPKQFLKLVRTSLVFHLVITVTVCLPFNNWNRLSSAVSRQSDLVTTVTYLL